MRSGLYTILSSLFTASVLLANLSSVIRFPRHVMLLFRWVQFICFDFLIMSFINLSILGVQRDSQGMLNLSDGVTADHGLAHRSWLTFRFMLCLPSVASAFLYNALAR